MVGTEELENINYEYQYSCDRVHLRFFCASSKAQSLLSKSFNKTWLDLMSTFPDCPVSIDLANDIILSIHPFSQNKKNKLKVFTSVQEQKVWTDGHLICGAKAPGLNKEVSDNLVSQIYNEQFYFRASVILFERESIGEIESILSSLFYNADMPNVILSSVEIESEDGIFPIDIEKAIPPVFDRFRYQPILEVDTLSAPMKLGVDSYIDNTISSWNENAEIMPVPIINLSKPSEEDKCVKLVSQEEFNKLGSPSIEVISSISYHTGVKDVAFFYEESLGRDFPIWEVEASKENSGGIILTRRVSVPVLDNLTDVFNIAGNYPVSNFFKEQFPSNYIILLTFSKIPFLPEMLREGLELFCSYDRYGKESFTLAYPNQDDESDEDGLVVFSGNKESLLEFFCKIISVHDRNGQVCYDDAYEISVEMGTLPEDNNSLVNYN
tara:strand:- start:8681 stop:9994 length:1314 start_codon:yes stop_codon:yes gene_type:complete